MLEGADPILIVNNSPEDALVIPKQGEGHCACQRNGCLKGSPSAKHRKLGNYVEHVVVVVVVVTLAW